MKIPQNPVPLHGSSPAFCTPKGKHMAGDEGAKGMISEVEVRHLINDLFEDEALLIGGLVAVHHVDDDLIWRLVKNLDVIRRKTLRRIEAREGDGGNSDVTVRPNLKRHPAIEDFLLNIRRA
jgi:hypothetical protein